MTQQTRERNDRFHVKIWCHQDSFIDHLPSNVHINVDRNDDDQAAAPWMNKKDGDDVVDTPFLTGSPLAPRITYRRSTCQYIGRGTGKVGMSKKRAMRIRLFNVWSDWLSQRAGASQRLCRIRNARAGSLESSRGGQLTRGSFSASRQETFGLL